MFSFLTIALLIAVAYRVGRFIENKSWNEAIATAAVLHSQDLETGTPIGSELAREMGIQL